MRELFRSLNFTRVWTGTLASGLAMSMQVVARGWFVYNIHNSTFELAVVLLAFQLPQVLVSLPGGVLADRRSKRTIIVVAHAFNACATLVLGILILGNNAGLTHFIVFGVLNGSVLALSFPSRQAILPHIVHQDLVFSALAMNATAVNISRVAGPAIAGILIYWISRGNTDSAFGVGVVYFVIAGLYLFASLISRSITVKGQAMSTSTTTSPKRDLIELADFVVRKPVVLALVVLSVVAYMFGHSCHALLPAFNESVLLGGARTYGFLLATLGMGFILGSLTIAWARDFRRKGAWLVGVQILWGILMILLGFTSLMWLAFTLTGLIGWIGGACMALNRSFLQSHVQTNLLGRVMSIDMIAHGMMPISSVPLGMLADAIGIDLTFSISGVLLIGLSLLTVLAVGARHYFADSSG